MGGGGEEWNFRAAGIFSRYLAWIFVRVNWRALIFFHSIFPCANIFFVLRPPAPPPPDKFSNGPSLCSLFLHVNVLYKFWEELKVHGRTSRIWKIKNTEAVGGRDYLFSQEESENTFINIPSCLLKRTIPLQSCLVDLNNRCLLIRWVRNRTVLNGVKWYFLWLIKISIKIRFSKMLKTLDSSKDTCGNMKIKK